MALYEKPATVTVDEDDQSKRVMFYQAQREDGTKVNRCTVDLPGMSPIDGKLADFLPLAADRTALGTLLQKATRNALVAAGATVKP